MWRALAATVETFRMVFRRESLPAPPPAKASGQRRGFASLLFAMERLPSAPEPPRRARAHWLRWLFLPEPLGREDDVPPEVH